MQEIPSKQEMINSFKKIEDKVEYILETYPQAKGDDTILAYRLLQLFYPQVKFSFKQFKDLLTVPAFESISRARRHLTEFPTGRRQDLRPSERVQHKRCIREDGLNEYFKHQETIAKFLGD